MQFVRTPKPSDSSVTTSSGHYTNSKGKTTHHRRKSETPVNFVAIDGEGMTVNGIHYYVLLGMGDRQISEPNGITWSAAFQFLYSGYRAGTAYVGFYLGYDFTQIFKTLPEDKAWALLTTEGRAVRKHRIPGKAPHPVECQGVDGKTWQFDILGMKRLRIRPKTCQCPFPTCKCKHKPWMYICDAGGFFQSSFMTVINPDDWKDGTAVVTAEEYATIDIGKEKRSTAVLDDDMRRYNLLENAVLERVMKTVDKGLHEIGIHLPPSKWFGPGQAAQAWLKKVGAPTRVEVEQAVPAWFLEAARASYFGGWFEIMMHGKIPGISHEYDINSAYPFIISRLPCLLHGKYTYGEGNPTVSDGDLCLVYAQVWSPNMPKGRTRQYIGSMLHRDAHGRILRPLASEGWYWHDELQAAKRAGCVKQRSTILRWVKYEPCSCEQPLRGMEGLYRKRLEVGKSSPIGKGAKLVYNSGYGKFAQSIGDPIYGNPVLASRITSGCRTMILNAIATHPKGRQDVAMVATDALFFLTPHPELTIGSGLGEWDHTERSNLTLFKPGVYWDDKTRREIAEGRSPHFKARGFRAADFANGITTVDTIFDAWTDGSGQSANDSGKEWPTVEFRPSFSMVTGLQALRQGDWSRAGKVTTGDAVSPVMQNANPSDKRTGLYEAKYDGRTVYRSEPYYGMTQDGEWIPSMPYTKRFGMEDPFSEEYKARMGEQPDGNVVDIIAWILKGE